MKKSNPALLIIFLTIFIDLLGFGIIIPLLPTFSIHVLHINESTIGLVAGIFSLMQFIFTPIWGGLSDRYGRKPILIMSLIGSVLSYILLGLVFAGVILSVTLLILSRAFAGIFAANISAAQAVISDVTSPEERTKGMGLIGAAFALGFVFGPAIGGVLSKNFGHGVPVFAAAFLSLCALTLCIVLFKETLPEEVQLKNRKSGKKIRTLDFKLIFKVLKSKPTGKLVFISFFIIFAFSNMFGSFQLFGERKDGLNLNEAEIGYLFSLLGVVGAFVQGVLMKYVRNFFGEEKTLVLGNFLSIFGLGLIGFSFNVPMLITVLTFLAVGNSMNNTVVLSLISQNVERAEMGTILGVNQSLGSLARFFGPLCGGFLYQYLGYRSPFVFGGIFMLMITIYSFYAIKKK